MSHGEAIELAHILLVVLVFALEIPVLVVEASTNERIRHLVHKRAPHRLITILMAGILVLAMLLISAPIDGPLEGAHVPPGEAERVEPVGLAVSPGTSADERVGNSGLTAPLEEIPHFSRFSLSPLALRLAVLAMLALFGISWLWMMRVDVRTRLVQTIRGALCRRYATERAFANEDLEDLFTLGENGAEGHEKKAVIRSIGEVCGIVQRSAKYEGDKLDVLLRGLVRIVSRGERVGNDENFLEALSVVRGCWAQIETSRLHWTADAVALSHSATNLGVFSLDRCSDMVALACLDAVAGVEVSMGIGAAAVKHGRVRVVIAALNRLATLAEESHLPSKELVALLALFHSTGDCARAWTDGIIERLQQQGIDVAETAKRAAESFFSIGDFGSSDAIRSVKWAQTALGN